MEPLRERYDAYCAARERSAYAEHAGWDAPAAPEEIDDAFGELTSGDALDGLRRERDGARAAGQRAGLERLCFAVESVHLDAAVRETRHRVEFAVRSGASLEAAGGLREELFVARGEARARLGYATGLARVAARLPGVDVERWVVEAERYLDATDVIYREARRSVLPLLGVDPDCARHEDMARVDQLGSEFDELFPAGRAVRCLGAMLDTLGVSLDRVKGLAIDDEPREGRAPGVRRFAIHVPGEVVVSVGRCDGPSAWAGMFHAVGRALAAAYTAENLPVERRRLHDRALEGAWGWWVSDRLSDPVWLQDFPSGRHAAALARGFHFRQLFAQRKCAGQVRFARELAELPAGADPRALADRQVESARRATGFAHLPPRYLEGHDGELLVLDAMRGRAFALALTQHLRERFGWRFWRERRAGELLKELWNTGTSYTVEELGRELGAEPWIDLAARGV